MIRRTSMRYIFIFLGGILLTNCTSRPIPSKKPIISREITPSIQNTDPCTYNKPNETGTGIKEQHNASRSEIIIIGKCGDHLENEIRKLKNQ